MNLSISPATADDAGWVAELVGELLQEIMDATGGAQFHFDGEETRARASEFIQGGRYFAFIARDGEEINPLGLVCLYPSQALYAEGEFGTIAELYVRPAFRSQGVGGLLLDQARAFGAERGWKRLEVTTPPLPVFEKTLAFYEKQGFAVTGGRKLKTLLSMPLR